MPFAYAEVPHVRKHGPSGYTTYQSYKDWLRDEFAFRCVYCLERERWYPSGHAGFGVDHVMPKARYEHLIYSYPNLVYACNRCNTAKAERILMDPCVEPYAGHLSVGEDGEITGLTPQGGFIIDVLGLDRPRSTQERLGRIRILNLYQRYPEDTDVRALYFDAFRFPDNLPDLSANSRAHNSKPEGIALSYYNLRSLGTLPDVYGV